MLEMISGDLMAEAAKQGLWAILYISLFVYTLKESRRQETNATQREQRIQKEFLEFREDCRKRETTLTTFINDITKQYERLAVAVERLSVDVDDIKDEIKIKNAKSEVKGE